MIRLGVQYPSEIENYKTIGSTPLFLTAGLVATAVDAFGLILIASVRRSRRDLALLSCLGSSTWQLPATIVWQASVQSDYANVATGSAEVARSGYRRAYITCASGEGQALTRSSTASGGPERA